MIEYDHDHENEIIYFGETNFRNKKRRFGIKTDDRRRHMYIVGKTGMGKTTLLENLVIQDIQKGHGVAYLDPHGDTAEKILDHIPSHRINDVIYFNPGDLGNPVGFNVLESVDPDKKHLVTAGLMGVFKKIWPDVWSARMEYILMNAIMALLEVPDATLLGISRLLADKTYRAQVVERITDPIVKAFWRDEFGNYTDDFASVAVAPIQNKVGQFLSASIIRNIVSQVKSTFDIRNVMDEGKILIVNLSKGKVGEDNSYLLGGMIVTKIQLSAMERVDIKNEDDRRDFYLYVDEFQNFATEAFAVILSEARKYHLNLIMAHQYIAQLENQGSTVIRDAVFGNVGTLVAMRVGAADAEFLEKEFEPRFTMNDLVNLSKFTVYLRLMIDGAASEPFSANSLAPISKPTGSYDKVIRASRERFAVKRDVMEKKIQKFSEAMQGSMVEAKAAAKAAKAAKKKPKIVAKCTDCGNEFNPPFRPTGDRPVYCPDCYELRKQGITPTAKNHVHKAGAPPDKLDAPVTRTDAPPARTVPTQSTPPASQASSPSSSQRFEQRQQRRSQRTQSDRAAKPIARPRPQASDTADEISLADALKSAPQPKKKQRDQRNSRTSSPQQPSQSRHHYKKNNQSFDKKDDSSSPNKMQPGDVVKF